MSLPRRFPATTLVDSYHAAGPLLPTLFASSVAGVAVLDLQMRFRAINGALAAMNGMPANRHFGRKVRSVLGGIAAPKVESAMDAVFQTGKPISLDLTAELPLRTGLGHWAESFFPIRDGKGRVTQVAAVVLETTEKRDLRKSLNHLVGSLLDIRAMLQAELQAELQFHERRIGSSKERSELFERTIELAEQCISVTQSLCEVPRVHRSTDLSEVRYCDVKDLRPLANRSTRDIDSRSRKEGDIACQLSPREHGVLRLLATGKNNKEVAAFLGISVRTAEAHRARLMDKVEIRSLANLVRFAVRNKIIEA